MDDKWDYLRGDVYLADLGPHFGSEQGGTRPVLLIQNNVGNENGPTTVVAAISSVIKKMYFTNRTVFRNYNDF